MLSNCIWKLRTVLSPAGRASWLAGAGLAALLLPLAFLLSACGGSDEPAGAPRRSTSTARSGGDGSSAAVEDLQEQALAELEKARKADAKKLFPEEFGRAEKRIQAAEDMLIGGQLANAEREFRAAIRSLKTVINDAQEIAGALKEAETARDKADEARKQAVALQAEQIAPIPLKEAGEVYEKGQKSLEEMSLRSLKSARGTFVQAAELFRQAGELAERNQRFKKLAESAREGMLKYKQIAADNQAETKALQEWQLAESEERRAESEMEHAEFQNAAQFYEAANRQYAQALLRVTSDAEFAKLMEQAKKEQEEERLIAAQKTEAELKLYQQMREEAQARQTARTSPTVVIPPTFPGGLPGGPGKAISFVPDCTQGLDPTQYPQNLDDEDEAFLQEHLSHLSPIAAAGYDPVTGRVLLDYTDGNRLKREKLVFLTQETQRNLKFEDQIVHAVGDLEQLRGTSTLSMMGFTKGTVLFPVPFRYRVRITWDLNIDTLTGRGTFGCIFNFDRNNHYRTNFLNIGNVAAAQVPKWANYPGEQGGPALNWYNRQRAVPWRVDFQMPDPAQAAKGATKSALITVVYDVDLDDERTNKSSIDSPSEARMRGFAGIYWDDVRFKVRNLQVCGILDKEKAVALLRRQLGIKKSKPSAKPAAGSPEEEPEEDPTAPAGGESALKPADKKKKEGDKDFDF
jgi:hypothetical protein